MGVADRMVTLSKKGTLHHRRQALAVVRDNETVRKLFSVLGPRYGDRAGGYTRVIRIGHRYGDAADRAIIEFIDREGELRKPRPGNAKSTKVPTAVVAEIEDVEELLSAKPDIVI